MARHRELVNPSDFLYFIPQLPKHLHISCQRCGIAGYIHNAVRLHAGHGVEEVFFAAFSRRIDDDDVRVLSGTVLAFARALGEYGATSMLAGNIPGKTGPVSQKIAMVIQDGDNKTAGFWSVVVLLVGFLAMTAMNLLGNRRKKNQKQW